MIDIQEEKKAFELNVSSVTWERIEYNAENNIYMAKSKYWTSTIVQGVADEIDFGWKMWQAAKAQTEEKIEALQNAVIFADECRKEWKDSYMRLRKDQSQTSVPEGFVLVSESKISCFYQDNDEPENCCLDASGFDSLGDCIDDGEVMLVNKFTQANISKQQMFGAWCACDPKPLTRFIKEFKLFDTQEEAEQAMIKALEQN